MRFLNSYRMTLFINKNMLVRDQIINIVSDQPEWLTIYYEASENHVQLHLTKEENENI